MQTKVQRVVTTPPIIPPSCNRREHPQGAVGSDEGRAPHSLVGSVSERTQIASALALDVAQRKRLSDLVHLGIGSNGLAWAPPSAGVASARRRDWPRRLNR
jgi:hypothetical protein